MLGRLNLSKGVCYQAFAEGRRWTGIDIFRLNQEGKIVNHWDVLQRIPTEAPDHKTIFWSTA
jgi:predicted SnoaL-like aldol condensation-catalyzing enzyme